jgi:uncharacterized protein YjbI with pentapeptide repeats
MRILQATNPAGADLSGADLTDVNLMQANLAGADLDGAHLKGANLSFANIADADFDLIRIRPLGRFPGMYAAQNLGLVQFRDSPAGSEASSKIWVCVLKRASSPAPLDARS